MHIAVVGAGIAGLTLGAALSRSGIRCRIYEQAPRLSAVGAGIQLAPNAVHPLQRLGLTEHLRAVGTAVQAIERRQWNDGHVVSRTRLGAECQDLFGAPYYTLHRADLHRGLLELLPRGTVSLGAALTAAVEHNRGVTLRFDDGSTAEADMVVGADGIRSKVRTALIDDTPEPAGRNIYRGLVDASRFPGLVAEPKVRLWLGRGQHVVCYPVSAGRSISFAATMPGDRCSAESWSATGNAEDLRSAYRGWDAELSAVLDTVDEVGLWSLHDRAPISRWSSARTTLIGDAAHPMLPFMAQGANQAIEDAVVLAACLRQNRDRAPEAALRRYEEIRLDRTARVQEGSRTRVPALHGSGSQAAGHTHHEGDTSSLGSRAWLYGYDAERAVEQKEGTNGHT
ncbi:FAD-dependent monooxygenase [Nocardiopsis salina]|uniref:FAD-dependent monooxygenase n=1 Tax=Nocardiopsis salina TaxID=245836 RepID=UPI0003464C9B|nr:FAD-dependent monooxygenase [Nocardiopsis salina]